MRKKLSSYMTSRYILIAVTVVCIIFVSTSFFTDSLVAPFKKCCFYGCCSVAEGNE